MTLEDEQLKQDVAEDRAFWASYGTSPSQRLQLLNAMRAFIVAILQNGSFEFECLYQVILIYTDRLSRNGLKQILAANAEWAWEQDEEGYWRLSKDESILVHGGIKGTRYDERLDRLKAKQICVGLWKSGRIQRVGSSGKFYCPHPPRIITPTLVPNTNHSLP